MAIVTLKAKYASGASVQDAHTIDKFKVTLASIVNELHLTSMVHLMNYEGKLSFS